MKKCAENMAIMIVVVCLFPGIVKAEDYMSYVKKSLNTLIEHGRDHYGKGKSPLFAANLNLDTMECMDNPPRDSLGKSGVIFWRLNRVDRRSAGGSNMYLDQAMLRAMALMSEVSKDPKYVDEINKAIKFQLHKAVDSNGFPAMGGHTFWNLYTDKFDQNGREFHEYWYWSMAWDLWLNADPEGTHKYADMIWEGHVVDKETGFVNRHNERIPSQAKAFPAMAGNFLECWANAYKHTKDEKYKKYMRIVANFFWNHRNKDTDLVYGAGEENTREDGEYYAMGEGTILGFYLIKSGKLVDDQELVKQGRAYLNAYAKYGYDEKKELFYGALTMDGKPYKAYEPRKCKGTFITGQTFPTGYTATWQPYCGWHELPLAAAQAYAWAAETVDKDAYLETALRWGKVIEKSWKMRYDGHPTWQEYAKTLDDKIGTSLLAELKVIEKEQEQKKISKNERKALRAKESALNKEQRALEEKRKAAKLQQLSKEELAALKAKEKAYATERNAVIGEYTTEKYPYTAPYGLFADHYGRTIQFLLTLYRVTGDQKWQDLAKDVANESIAYLWKERLFIGHPAKKNLYENCDNIGILLYSLLQLQASIDKSDIKIPVIQ